MNEIETQRLSTHSEQVQTTLGFTRVRNDSKRKFKQRSLAYTFKSSLRNLNQRRSLRNIHPCPPPSAHTFSTLILKPSNIGTSCWDLFTILCVPIHRNLKSDYKALKHRNCAMEAFEHTVHTLFPFTALLWLVGPDLRRCCQGLTPPVGSADPPAGGGGATDGRRRRPWGWRSRPYTANGQAPAASNADHPPGLTEISWPPPCDA